MRALFLFVAIMIAGAIAYSVNKDAEMLFGDFVKQHKKIYSSFDEFATRFRNFKASVERVQLKNSKSKHAVYGITRFSDMSPEEFRSSVLMDPYVPNRPDPARYKVADAIESVPQTFDWRDKGAVTPVKDQEQCGSCWAFSATEAIESTWILSGHQVTELAPQQILSCDELSFGCDGGAPESAYHYVIDAGGLDTEQSYPYEGEAGPCYKNGSVGASIKDWHYATLTYSESEVQQKLLSWGPLSVCVDASNWQDYNGGIMTADECAYVNLLDHCVQLVGYNMASSPPYWIVRNSWNTDWGIDGFIYLEMGQDTCGIAHEVTWPTVN